MTNVVNNAKSATKGILVVEDNMLLTFVYEMQIRKLGHRLLAKIPDGNSAINAVNELKPDLIIMDIFLEGDLDGIETMEKIRQFSKVPVIYITGNSDKYHTIRAEKTNYADYLIKPVSNQDLLHSIKRAIN